MADMTAKRAEMPVLDADIRNKCFDEVAKGYTPEQAKSEANRCLGCKKAPCKSGCPVGINIPEFIEKIKQDDISGAYETIALDSSLAAVCGRVCPQEKQCEQYCVRGIKGESVAIGRLERYAADNGRVKSPQIAEKTGRRFAVVGSGPAGLSCAAELAKNGHSVTVYEALHTVGGVLMYGIPEFRLPKKIVCDMVSDLEAMGVVFRTDTVIGRTLTVDELLSDGCEAVFLGTGAGLPRFMNIAGENLIGVFSANEFLTRINLMKAYLDTSDTPVMKADRVAVVGGGNVAMDAARCAKRLGASEVYIVYRRSEEELPARAEEVEHAKEEGIEFRLLCNPVEILGQNGRVTGIRCVEMTLGEPDSSGRRRPVEKPDSLFDIQLDCVIMAIGTSPNPLIGQTTPMLEINKYGCVVTKNEDGLTSRENVYAGGDAVTGAATVILAMGAGKSSARAMQGKI